jgi:hypothetical protein
MCRGIRKPLSSAGKALPSSLEATTRTQSTIRLSITRFKPRFSRYRYQHTARVILPTLKRVRWIHLYLRTPCKT